MFKNKFNKIVTISFTVIAIFIIALIGLNTFSLPHVVDVSIIGGKDSAHIKNQQIKITFNRPILKESIEKYITTQPSFDFRPLWSANSLLLIPSQSLDSNTTYTLTFSGEITDIYNEKLEHDYVYTFRTNSPELALIEKNVNTNQNTISVFDANLNKKEELFSGNNIKFYGINTNYLVVVSEENFANKVTVINRVSKEVRSLDFQNIRIGSFTFSPSPYKNEFAYTKQTIEVKSHYYIPKEEAKIYIYNLDDNSEKIFNPNNTANDVVSLKYSQDGNSLLYKSGDSFFHLAETSNIDNYTSLGRFLAEGNFNYDSTMIAFLAFDPLNVYTTNQYITVFDSERNTKDFQNDNVPVLDPRFLNRSNKIIFSEQTKELPSTKGIYKLVSFDMDGNKEEILESEDYSLELPVISPDDRYIAIEQYTEIQLTDFNNSRSMGFQNKPNLSTIIIYDTIEKRVINNGIIGIDAKWI